jgi:L-seryl-tRNA(Ser) seleniumtransferase
MTSSTYATLGLRPVINAQARLTRLGGSKMPPEVLEAMAEASRCYVDMFELQRQVGARLAELTHNEAAYVSTGAATALFLSSLATMVGSDPAALAQLPALAPDAKDEIIIHKAQRFTYDPAVRLAGARFMEIGTAEATARWELEEAITPRTAAVLFVAGGHYQRGALRLEEVIEVAHANDIPVIVDAAAQLPPVENLWHFTRDLGADIAIFSGGKDLQGPQASGLVVGKQVWIERIFANGSPNPWIGRPMKVGREEMLGLLAAVERYLTLDHAARLAGFEAIVQGWTQAFDGLPGVRASRAFPNEAGQPMPRLLLELDPAVAGMTGDEARRRLWEGNPRIAAGSAGAVGPWLAHDLTDDTSRGLYLTPDTLDAGEEHLITERLLELLKDARPK